MKNHGMNPYLPSWEYVPDGEPHVFGKRVYIEKGANPCWKIIKIRSAL